MGPWLVDARNREELDMWLEGLAPVPYRPVVMVVRGDDTLVREYLPNALDAAKLDERRVVLWVKDESLLEDDDLRDLFQSNDAIVAAVLSEDHRVTSWVYRDQTEVDDADFAFATAQGRRT